MEENFFKLSPEMEEKLSKIELICYCSACARRAIISRMKEDLLDKTKTIPTPTGVGSEIWEKYVRQIRSSDGFDLDQENIPKECPHATLSILPIKGGNQEYSNLCYLANKSLEWMNAKNDTSYKVVEVTKANVMEGGMGILYTYFISFTAKEPEKPVMEFQAKVESLSKVSEEGSQGFQRFLDGSPRFCRVEFCRVKPEV